MSTEVAFKLVQESDIERLLDFIRDFHAYGGLPFEHGAVREALEALVRDRSLGRAWLICDGQAPIGYAVLTLGYSLEFHGRDAFVDELYIVEGHRGRGIGTRVLRFLEDEARSLGVHALHLEVDRGDAKAQEFYRRASYEDHDRYLMTKWLIK